MKKPKIIACDFDGCLVEDRWPQIGLPIEKNIEALREEVENGAIFILWTCRVGKELDEAVAFCRSFELYPDAVNANPFAEIQDELYGNPRKIFATEYWDDRAVHKSKDSGELKVKSLPERLGAVIAFGMVACICCCLIGIVGAVTVRLIQWLTI